jgi:hypothetical protein
MHASVCGRVERPCSLISLGLHTGTKEMSVNFSIVSDKSPRSSLGKFRIAISTPSVVKLV